VSTSESHTAALVAPSGTLTLKDTSRSVVLGGSDETDGVNEGDRDGECVRETDIDGVADTHDVKPPSPHTYVGAASGM